MVGLPSGTVSLLFSDIEGSTALLSRLGATYADALDGQRRLLRRAWGAHQGIELGTEGDSFFVVFPTAPSAVRAAAQAQRELAAFEWPSGERVRVRMGIHSGSPTPHDGGYVGMDVHRAARIASAAHGEQVLVSSTTAQEAENALPDGVALRDLGRHKLKDIPSPERLLQLVIDGLRSDFPQLKTLGAATSLPMQATPLVGRESELSELSAELSSPAVRLVTLTGPGGSGKTRLAIELARRSVDWFPDGVHFVPLATVTGADLMWTSLAEALAVPTELGTPGGVAASVEHLRPLLVLDNLEQLVDADAVVAYLLQAAPRLVVIATSRRPLRVLGEHEYPVQPLELPTVDSLENASASDAVQFFVQQARLVRPSFALTAENAADVATVCRRLDGLPLALELAAARSKLLSPQALLARLDSALDMAARSDRSPSRQKTLRDTIRWSFDLLPPPQQVFFRRLGVFSGGADLDAVSTVILGDSQDADGDAFDLVAELVDASLVVAAESPTGELRISMLETVRSYALDELRDSGELDVIAERHARHFLGVAQQLSPLLCTGQRLTARARLNAEHDNLREALRWTLPDTQLATSPERLKWGLALYTALRVFWEINGNFAEDQRWVQQAIDRAGGTRSPELGRCLFYQAANLRYLGDLDRAYEQAAASVGMLRRLGDASGLSHALNILASVELQRGNPSVVRALRVESVRAARESKDRSQLRAALGHLATLEALEANYEVSLELEAQALALALELDDRAAAIDLQQNMACTLRQMGRADEARVQMRRLIPQAIAFNEPSLMVVAEDYAAILADLEEHQQAVRLLGAADQSRQELGLPRDPLQEVQIAEPMARTREALSLADWQAAYEAGGRMTVEMALRESTAAVENGSRSV